MHDVATVIYLDVISDIGTEQLRTVPSLESVTCGPFQTSVITGTKLVSFDDT